MVHLRKFQRFSKMCRRRGHGGQSSMSGSFGGSGSGGGDPPGLPGPPPPGPLFGGPRGFPGGDGGGK